MIGAALVTALRDRGDDVVVLQRAAAKVDGAVAWDAASGYVDVEGLRGVDAIVHLAGESIGAKRWSPAQKRELVDSRVKGTGAISRAAAAAGVRVLVSGSAIGYYGSRGDEVLTEESAQGRGFLADLVGRWEAAAAPAEDAGLRVAFARTGLVLDRSQGALAKMLPLFRFGLGGPFGRGNQWWSWISRRDEVRALLWLLDHDLSGPVNLTAPSPVTNRDFAAALGKALKRPAKLPVPPFGPKLLMGGEMVEELLFASQRVEPRRLVDSGFTFADDGLAQTLSALVP